MKNYKIMMLMALSLSFAVQASWHRPFAVSADEGRIDQDLIARANQMLLLADTAEQVQAALDTGADVNTRNNRGWTALMDAVLQGHENMIRMLLAAGADVNARSNSGWTALMYTVLYGYENMIRMLLGWNDQMDVLLARDDISDEAKSRLVPLEPQAVQDTLDWIQTARQDQANVIYNYAIAVRPEMMQMLQDYLDAHPVSDYLLK